MMIQLEGTDGIHQVKINIAVASVQKPVPQSALMKAISAVMKTQPYGIATNHTVYAHIAELYPTFPDYHLWKLSVNLAASRLVKQGKLQNGMQHGEWGVWKWVQGA